jgi:putative oxidoreductase
MPGLLQPLPGHNYMLSVMRIVVALVYLQHGTQKMIGFPPTSMAPPEMFSLIWYAGVIETVGGLLLVLGLLTRPAAFIVAGELAYIYFFAHQPRGLWPAVNGGNLAIAYCFTFLYVFFAGPGPWSLDSLIFGRNRTDTAPSPTSG